MDLGIPPLPQEVFDHCGLKALDVFREDAVDFMGFVCRSKYQHRTYEERKREREPQ